MSSAGNGLGNYKGLVIAPGHPMDGKYMSNQVKVHRTYEERVNLPIKDFMYGLDVTTLPDASPKNTHVLEWHEGLYWSKGRHKECIIQGMWLDPYQVEREDPQQWAWRTLIQTYSTAKAVGRAIDKKMERAPDFPVHNHFRTLALQLKGGKNGD